MLYNMVLIPKLKYHMQVTYFSELEYNAAIASICTVLKHKAQLSHSFSNAMLYLQSAFGLINLFAYQQ